MENKTCVAVYQNQKYVVRLLKEVEAEVKSGFLQEDNMLLTFQLTGDIEEKKIQVEKELNE